MKNIKLQYYLRGLGVGILVTALIMGFALPKDGKQLTDAQIKERALELGMVDSNSLVLSDLKGDEFVKVENSEDITESLTSTEIESNEEIVDATESLETMEAEDATETLEQEVSEEATESTEVVESEEVTENTDTVQEVVQESQGVSDIGAESTEGTLPRVNGTVNEALATVTIEIRPGANSYSVSKILADTGLVADAWAYDNYLCNNGYSKRIHTGKYLIAIGTSEEEIAQIITGNR